MIYLIPILNVDNNIFQIYTKLGKIKSDNRSIGSQTSFTLHNQNIKLGNTIYKGS